MFPSAHVPHPYDKYIKFKSGFKRLFTGETMQKIKVLQFITGLHLGGAEKMMLRTIEHLDHNKFDLQVASLVGGELEKEISGKFPLHLFNTPHLFDFFTAINKLHRLIKKEEYDLIHSYMFHANIIARIAAVGTNAKVISSIRIKEIKYWHHTLIDALTSFLVDKYTCVSESVRQFVIKKEHLRPEKILTIPNAIDFNQFPKKVNILAKKKELGIDEKTPVIMSVANLRKTKDYPTLFNALAIVLHTQNVHLLVVGSGEAEEAYRKIPAALGISENVHFLGFRDDVFELIMASDLCVLSTFYEGQSNALLEYMALKKPIIATDIEENREVITNGKEGILVKEKNPTQMAEAILHAITDKKTATTMANNAYARVTKEHNITTTVRSTEELYQTLCAE